MTPSQAAKSAGYKSLAEVSILTGVSTITLNNWYKNKPLLFKAVLHGAKYLRV